MTQPLPSSRKRVRNNNCEEECCDFMPLSKRINNLHINNGNCCNGLGFPHPKHSTIEQEGGSRDEGPCDSVLLGFSSDSDLEQSGMNVNHAVEHYRGGSSNDNSPHSWMTEQILSHYSPDLNASDNPYYYENNKLLFALYMERMQRGGHELF